MSSAAEIVSQYGALVYPITLVWTFLEGETFVIVAGALASAGLINLWLLILSAWIGSFLADQVAFAIGRAAGPKLLERAPRLKPKVEKATAWLERNATLFILSFRFVYGLRNVAAIAIALSPISWRRFALLNFIAAGVWAISFAGLGYVAGRAIEKMADQLVRQIGLVALGVFAAVLVGLLIRNWWLGRQPPKAP